MYFIPLSFLLIASAYGSGEFSVLHHAPSLVFKGHDALKDTTVKEVYAAALGFSTHHFSNWRGMYLTNPFEVAKAIVTVYVDGVSDIGQQKGHNYPLSTNEGTARIYKSLERRITEHFPETPTNLVKIRLSNGLEDVNKYPIFNNLMSGDSKQLGHKFLKLDVEEDRQFLKDCTILREIASRVAGSSIKVDAVPDVFWFEVGSFHPLVDFYGENSSQVLEAKQILNEVILEVNSAFNKLYDGYVLVSVITSDASHTRKGRSLLQSKSDNTDTNDKTKYNLASYYSKDYPVIFNIILWFGIMMLFSLIAISLAIGNMDPGRDSIIYRMTSTRMKKDN
ncbi:unnamed protein product [Phyllotreta striolata]|uniref:Renin receptor n=1 Tax=Phyllotreta striolata TaxID=444603 RepID=A0A9N9XNP6_PHYSR|nr:unnamed protein product [Phyllotreta striolata]